MLFARRPLLILLLFTLSLLSQPAHALACGERELPANLHAFLRRSQAGWSILEPDKLDTRDQVLWKRRYRNQCPGMVVADLTGGGLSYAVNLINTAGGRLFQQVVVLHPKGRRIQSFVLLASMHVTKYSVLAKVAPRRFRSIAGGEQVITTRPSLALIAFAAGTVQYYWDGSRFRSIITAD